MIRRSDKVSSEISDIYIVYVAGNARGYRHLRGNGSRKASILIVQKGRKGRRALASVAIRDTLAWINFVHFAFATA